MHSIKNILHAVRNFLFSGMNKEFLIFLFFLALSGGFWLMMSLNETMEREFAIPVQLVGTPRNAVITGNLPDTVKVTVRDKGFTLATYAYGRKFRPLTFKFASYADDDTGAGIIPQADVQKQVVAQLYGSSKLLAVKPRLTRISRNSCLNTRIWRIETLQESSSVLPSSMQILISAI